MRSSASSHPPVAPGEELLGHAERRAQRLPLVLVPAVQRGDVGEPVGGEVAQHLELGVDPRLELAEHLEHELIVDHQRGVRLLDSHRPHARVLADRGHAVGPVEAEPALSGLELVAAIHSPHQLDQARRLGQCVVGGPVLGAGDGELGHRIPASAQQERELVELVRAGGEARLHERQEQRRLVAQRHCLDDLDAGHRARLGGVPALMGDPSTQALLVEALADLGHRDLRGLGHSLVGSSGSTSANQ